MPYITVKRILQYIGLFLGFGLMKRIHLSGYLYVQCEAEKYLQLENLPLLGTTVCADFSSTLDCLEKYSTIEGKLSAYGY